MHHSASQLYCLKLELCKKTKVGVFFLYTVYNVNMLHFIFTAHYLTFFNLPRPAATATATAATATA